MDPFQLAENLERSALAWAADARLYKGRRRQWRENKALRLMARCNAVLNEEAISVVRETVEAAKPRELQPGVFSE